jgi:hypothetical protein
MLYMNSPLPLDLEEMDTKSCSIWHFACDKEYRNQWRKHIRQTNVEMEKWNRIMDAVLPTWLLHSRIGKSSWCQRIPLRVGTLNSLEETHNCFDRTRHHAVPQEKGHGREPRKKIEISMLGS